MTGEGESEDEEERSAKWVEWWVRRDLGSVQVRWEEGGPMIIWRVPEGEGGRNKGL